MKYANFIREWEAGDGIECLRFSNTAFFIQCHQKPDWHVFHRDTWRFEIKTIVRASSTLISIANKATRRLLSHFWTHQWRKPIKEWTTTSISHQTVVDNTVSHTWLSASTRFRSRTYHHFSHLSYIVRTHDCLTFTCVSGQLRASRKFEDIWTS